AMADVTFEVWRDGVSLGKFRTDEFGEILLTDVTPGTYRAVEVDTGSDGHILDTTPQEVELAAGDGIKELLFFNDVKPGLRLVKVDSTDPSRVIPNAVFEIKSVDGSYGPKEFTTDENGEIDLSKLPTGAYVVTEKACEGYIIDQAQRIIQLDPNEDAQFVFTNTIKPSLQIIKTSSDGSRLKNVTFRIAKIEDGTHYLDRTTNEQGEILIAGLELGVYSVRETATDSSHILDVREYHMELFPGKTSTLTVENQKRPNLIVYKHDADTGEPIANTVFEIRAADGHSVDQIKTDSEGKAELRNLLPGVYEITEKSVPSPYLLDAPSQLATLYPNRDHTVYFENHKKPSLTVKKLDSVTGDALQGAKFQVTYASNNTVSGEINDLGTFYTDENGQFQLTGLQDGWYKVTELEPPTGYAIKEATQEVYIKSGTGKILTFENIPLSALVVWKYDSVTGEAVPNAVFQVKYLTGTSGTGGTVIGTYKTSANGSFTVTGLREGTYIVEELASDSGHVIDTAPQTAYISGKEQDVVQLYFGNTPKGALLVKKVDSATGKPISDVEFMITTSNGTVVGDGNGKFITDSAGSFTVSGITPGTTLVVKETRAKEGYVLDDTPQTAKILAGQTVTLEFRNAPKGNLIINKLDSVTGKPLEGVQFKITYADGRFVDAEGGKLSSNGLYVTDRNGQIILNQITGTIMVTEVQTIPGYSIDENTRTQTVVVNPDDTQTLTFANTPVGGLIITKSDESSGKRLSGVQFEVRKMNGEIIGTYTTDRNGVIQLPQLDSGWYTVTELKTVSGYQLDTTPQQVEVKDGQTATLALTNRKTSNILLHKVDADTGKGIYGATFLLYDSSHNPIGQYTTDQNGYIYMDEGLADG
ncbi:MSCRAMM family protein, partial [Dysosmobacter sp.]|uniref:MSCRAMM family protein n=1 Tax=Dysosmobacter sp. TaxID=2591382 RepID=UPI002A9BB2FD